MNKKNFFSRLQMVTGNDKCHRWHALVNAGVHPRGARSPPPPWDLKNTIFS